MQISYPQGVIFLGHEVSEEPGMRLCADWLKTFMPEVPVEWISAGEQFWQPAAGHPRVRADTPCLARHVV